MKTKKIILLSAITMLAAGILKAQDVEEAKQLIDNERYQSAETLLEKSTATASPDPETSYLLVKTYIEQDKNEEAKKYIDQYILPAIGTSANEMDKIAYARYLMGIENKPAADEIITTLLNEKKNQKNATLLMAMAEIQIESEKGDALLALSWLDMASKRDKNNAAIDILKGQAYRKISDASNAFASYQEALKKDNKNVKAHYLIGKIFTAQKNPEIYLEHFQQAYRIDSTFAPVLEELYNYYYYRDVKEAKKYLLQYIAHSDYSLQKDYYMTDILYLNGEYPAAIAAARKILDKEGNKSQPRLYKLIAYSFAKSGDTAKASQALNQYFDNETPDRLIASDFELRAQLIESITGGSKDAITYYSIAAEMDTINGNKANYAAKIASLAKGKEDYGTQALWLGRLYNWKGKSNNVDLFNWGLAHYSAKEYQLTDSVFSIYTTRFPDDIFGYYWRAQANAAIDSTMTEGLAIPYYNKVVEIGETNKETNKKMLLKAYGYLAGYEANITKNYPASLQWFQKYLEIDPENSDIKKYVELLEKWIADKK